MKKKEKRELNEHLLFDYQTYMIRKERSSATIGKYLRDIQKFTGYLEENHTDVCLEQVLQWKQWLLSNGYLASSINSMLAALNSFFEYAGWQDCKVKLLRIQKESFTKPERELGRLEYLKLLETARKTGNERISLIMQTICSTGIRISELSYITVNAVLKGKAQIQLKGKIRTVFLPDSLRKILKNYIHRMNRTEGSVFLSKKNLPIGRISIWKEMKALCEKAGIAASKVFPHNLRHLFAKTHYEKYHDVIRLSDILGHSSVDTTRIYTLESGQTHLKQLNLLGLTVEMEKRTT